MRKARKPLCLLLCAVLLLSMSAAALGANNNYSSWFQTNYDEINKLGLMPASFNGLDLTKNITRGEMCELAVYAFEKATGNDIDMFHSRKVMPLYDHLGADENVCPALCESR